MDVDTIRAKLRQEKRLRTYDQLCATYGVDRWNLWNLINDDHFQPAPHVLAKLGGVALVPTPACSACGVVHTIDGVCVARSVVKIQVIQVTPEELAAIEHPVTVIVKQSTGVKRQRARASINLEDPESAARTIQRKMDAETLALLLALLKETP